MATQQTIGRYEVLEELGHGAMGTVFRAKDPVMARIVALKTVRSEILSGEQGGEFRERFLREARAAGALAHPGIVPVFDVGEHEGIPYLVMEFISGRTLAQAARTGERLPLERVCEIGQQIAEALGYAHQHGVVHRDIKAANILLTSRESYGIERPKITDFGVAKLAAVQITTTGQMLGTPAFMPPEQFTGGAIDGRTDLFSLGVILYWMATGEYPFPGETLVAVSYKVMNTEPVPPRKLNPAVPKSLDAVILKCLAKNPADRYQSGGELARELAAVRAAGMATTVRATAVAAPGALGNADAIGSGGAIASRRAVGSDGPMGSGAMGNGGVIASSGAMSSAAMAGATAASGVDPHATLDQFTSGVTSRPRFEPEPPIAPSMMATAAGTKKENLLLVVVLLALAVALMGLYILQQHNRKAGGASTAAPGAAGASTTAARGATTSTPAAVGGPAVNASAAAAKSTAKSGTAPVASVASDAADAAAAPGAVAFDPLKLNPNENGRLRVDIQQLSDMTDLILVMDGKVFMRRTVSEFKQKDKDDDMYLPPGVHEFRVRARTGPVLKISNIVSAEFEAKKRKTLRIELRLPPAQRGKTLTPAEITASSRVFASLR